MFLQRSSLPLVFAFIANGMAYAFFIITLPVLGRQLDFSDTNTSLILGISALSITLVSPLWGQISESWGRRNVIVTGMLATTFFTVASGLIIYFRQINLLPVQAGFLLLLSTRLLNSLFTGGLKPAGQAYISDITAAQDRAKGMGVMGAAFGIGSILGGMTASISGSDYLLSAYGFISLLLAISSALTFIKLSESRQRTQGNHKTQKHTSLPYNRIWYFLLMTVVGLLIFSLLQHIVGLTLQDNFKLPAGKAIRLSGMTMMLTMVTMILTQLFLIKKLNAQPKTLIKLGLFIGLISLSLAATILLTQIQLIPLLIGSIALFGLGLGLLVPGNLAALSLAVDEDSQARVAGINGISQGVGLALGPILATALHQITYSAPYVLSACLLLLLIGMYAIKNANKGITAWPQKELE